MAADDLSLSLPSFEMPELNVPQPSSALVELLSNSGTYKDGDLVIDSKLGLLSQNTDIASLDDLLTIRRLGAGSSAVVKLVEHKISGQQYALKEMQLSVDAQWRDRMRKELIINQIQREHVVACHQTFVGEGRIYIVLEYMDGGSLADVLLKQQKIPEHYLAEVARQTLQGLLSLHRDHIIHRDIKPSNILLSKSGQVKLTDFGVSTLLTSTADVARTPAGTYTYMSPERISGDTYSYNSDTWALGLSILECAIGHFPYVPPKHRTWNSFFELLNTVVRKSAPRAPADQFSPEFCSFIEQCVEKDPEKRLSAAQALEHPFILKHISQDINIGELCVE